jgi:hypothetical protein
MRAAEARNAWRVVHDETSISFELAGSGHAMVYPLDGTEALTTTPRGRPVRVSGRWLPDDSTLELTTVELAEDGTPVSTVVEHSTLAPDGRSLTLRRMLDGPQGKQDYTLFYRRAE